MTAKDDINESSAPLVEHLIELRNRLIWSVAAFLIAMVLCFFVAEPILDFLLAPIEDAMRELGDPNPVMQYTAPQEYFFTLVHISVVTGLMVSFPVIGYQLWRFIAPGLYRSEKQAFLPFLLASPILFRREIAAGLLVRPFAQTVPLTAGYWLCWPTDRRRSRKIVRFRDWLVAEARDEAELMLD